jgi:hypothetical protein
MLLFSCSSNKQQQPDPNEFSVEERPKTSSKKVLHKKPNFQLERYANWTIDSSDKSFDPDNYLELNSPSDNGFAMFFIFEDQIDEKEYVDDQVKGYVNKLIKKAKVSYFDQWGIYHGYGAKIEGVIMGLLKSEIKVFAHATDSLSFSTVTQVYLDDLSVDEPGLELIESTFKLKE